MQKITSKDNDLIKHLKKLKDKKFRDKNNEYLIEGVKLIQEAIQEKMHIKKIVICDECEPIMPKELLYEIARFECVSVSEQIFKNITDVSTPQGIIAIIEK